MTPKDFYNLCFLVYTPGMHGRYINLTNEQNLVFHRYYERMLRRHENEAEVRKLYPVVRRDIPAHMDGDEHVPAHTTYQMSRGMFILLMREVWPTLDRTTDPWIKAAISMHKAGGIYAKMADELAESMPLTAENYDAWQNKIAMLHVVCFDEYEQAEHPLDIPASNTGVTS